jgi:hypothetical protein
MYSPKISEKHIPVLYKIAKAKRIPMTRLVNQILEAGIRNIDLEDLEKRWVVSDISEDLKQALCAILCVLGRKKSKR